MTSAHGTTPDASPGRSGRWAPVLVFAAALVLFALTRRAGTFSDAVQLADRVAAGPTPYYNALYLPVGWVFYRVLGVLAGLDAYGALAWLSVVAGAGSVALVWVLLDGVVREPLARLAWCALFALAPGVWFFAASVEVHALQLLCVTAATILAWRARSAPSGRAPFLLAAAMLVALVGHLTSVLVLPALAVLAIGSGPGRGLSLRALPWKALGTALVLLVAACFLVDRAFEAWGGRLGPIGTLSLFWKFLTTRITESGWFTPSEVLAFLRRELVAPAGVLVAGIVVALFQKGDRRLALAVVVLLLPYVLALPQGGIRENGAYYLSLLPFLVLGAARALEARAGGHALGLALLLLVIPQAWLGWREVVADGGGEDSRVWAAAIDGACPDGSVVYTATLPRWHALAVGYPTFEAVDVWRIFEMTPASAWDLFAAEQVRIAREKLAQGQRVFVDADLFRAGDRPEGVERLAASFDQHFSARAPVPPENPLVFEFLGE